MIIELIMATAVLSAAVAVVSRCPCSTVGVCLEGEDCWWCERRAGLRGCFKGQDKQHSTAVARNGIRTQTSEPALLPQSE